jgi:hypothetical protein
MYLNPAFLNQHLENLILPEGKLYEGGRRVINSEMASLKIEKVQQFTGNTEV